MDLIFFLYEIVEEHPVVLAILQGAFKVKIF
jgi:hypothetical protein